MKHDKKHPAMPAANLSAGIAELEDLLTRLSKGDTALRADTGQEDDIFRGIKLLINQLAEHIQETSDYAHEMAIGLCGHYDTLSRIAGGDFSIRATMDSGNELVGKLGELINREADVLTGAISRAKCAEEEAKNAYQQLQDIIEFLPDATFVVDKEKRVIAWNRAIEKMTGLKKEDVLGKGDYAYAIPFYGERRKILIDLVDEDVDVISRDYTAIKIEGRTLFAETYVPSFQNGDSRYFWGTASPLFDKQGNKVGGIESIRDITEYRRSEQENTRLESQLHYAHMIESLMIKLGHDLRTPLTPLTILLPLIEKRVNDLELRKMVDICCKSTLAMKKLADKSQFLGKISTSVNQDVLESINLYIALEQILSEHMDSMAQKNVTCRNDIDRSMVVQVIPEQIFQLFDNLISNAIRYSPQREVIRVTAEEHNGVITVAVHDDGIGLAPENLERIFDEFFKVDESRHDLDASGLGLAICKRIVHNHHGRIWAESAGIGRGTTIKFTINEQSTGNGSAKELK